MSYNHIVQLEICNFICMPNLVQLHLKFNEITLFGKHLMKYVHSLVYLDLSNNNMNSFILSDQTELKLLILYENEIQCVDKQSLSMQVTFIVTNDFHVCCLFLHSNSMCSLKYLWPHSCPTMLLHLGLKTVSFCIGTFVVLVSTLSILLMTMYGQRLKRLKAYNSTTVIINCSDFTIGLCFIVLAVKNVLFGVNFLESDLMWRSSIECHLLAFLILWSILSEAWFMMIQNVVCYRVAINPLENPFSQNTAGVLFAIIPTIKAASIVILLILRHQVEGLLYLPSSICSLLGKTDKSFTQSVATTVLPALLLAILATILLFCLKLLHLGKHSNGDEPQTNKIDRGKAAAVIVMRCLTNILCWIPTSIFCVSSVLTDKFLVVPLQWVTFVVFPLNAIMNPVLFALCKVYVLGQKKN